MAEDHSRLVIIRVFFDFIDHAGKIHCDTSVGLVAIFLALARSSGVLML
jgi:hypothetical protein